MLHCWRLAGDSVRPYLEIMNCCFDGLESAQACKRAQVSKKIRASMGWMFVSMASTSFDADVGQNTPSGQMVAAHLGTRCLCRGSRHHCAIAGNLTGFRYRWCCRLCLRGLCIFGLARSPKVLCRESCEKGVWCHALRKVKLFRCDVGYVT